MKKILTLVCAITMFFAAHAQCPQYVAFDTTVCGSSISRTIDATVLASRLCGDSIQIIFNDSGTVLNSSPQVYLHSGPEFRPFTGWQNRYTVDTGSSQAGRMTRIGTHLWSIRFNPRTYFNYSPDSCLNAIALGFRDSNYTNYLKCGPSNDIYIVTATGTAVNTCASATFMTATYTHSTNISYLWNDGNTNGVRTFTTGGTYTVTATGVGGCNATGRVHIVLDNSHVSIGDDTTECFTSSYVFVATPGFATYQWNDARPFTSNTQQAINPGQYIVRAVDSSGCASSDTAQVHLSPTGYLSLPATLSSCPGTPVSADASTTINFNGDSLVITYDATLGLTQLVGDTNVYFHSAPQFYPFAGWPANDPYTVGNYGQNDGVGRMQSLGNNKWRITIDPQTYYHYSPDTPLNGIWMIFRNFDGSKTGKDSSTANNNNIYLYTVPNPPTSSFDGVTAYHRARQPLTYTWSNGVHTPADTFTTGGTYYVTVTDGVCTHSDSVVVTFSANATINIGIDTTVCSASDSVVITATAGYTHYTWSTGATTQSIRVSGANNTYTVTATNSTGCTATGHRSVSISSRTLSLGPDIVKCANTPTTLTATAGFASYQWLQRAATTADTFSATHTGTYWVQATDSAGCVATDTVSVRYSEVLREDMPDTLRNCPGNLVNLDAGSNISIVGDSITIFYDATQGQTQLVGDSNVYFYSAPQFYPFAGWPANDPYTVGNFTQNNGIGRMDSLGNNRWSITIFPQSYYHASPDTPIIGIWMVFRNFDGTKTGKDNSGNNIFLNISTVTPTSTFSGVTAIHKEAGTLSYLWSTGDIAPAIAVDSSGLYTVTVTDNSGCHNTDSTRVIIASTLTVNIGHDTTICPSGRARFDAGVGYTAYRWSTGDSTQAITVSAPGTYTLTAFLGNCSAVDSATIRLSGAKINLGPDVTRCTNAPATLTAPTGYVSYLWFGAGTSTRTRTAVHDGCYWILATDSTGCTSYDTIGVTTAAISGLHGHDTVYVCTGDSARLDVSAGVVAAGDSIVIIYDASQGQSALAGDTNVYMHSAPQFYPFVPWGTSPYTVGNYGRNDGVGRMTSLGGNIWRIAIDPYCYYGVNPDSAIIGIWMIFRNFDGTKTGKDPNGQNIILDIATDPFTSPFSGVSGYRAAPANISYAWSNTGSSAVGTFTTSGTYYVTATEGSCTKTDTVSVIAATTPVVNLGPDTCLGISTRTVVLNAGTGYSTYLWSTGASTQTITANQPGPYWVTVTNAAGCTATDSVQVADSCTAVNVITHGCIPVAYFRVLNISPYEQVTFKDSSYSLGTTFYRWTFGDATGTVVTGSGNQVHTYALGGSYTVTLTVCDSCTSDTICSSYSRIVTVNNTGISEISGLNSVNLYPNPASNSCTIEVNASENQYFKISVTDLIGNAVEEHAWAITPGENKIQLDLSDMSAGLYTVSLRCATGLITRKLNVIK